MIRDWISPPITGSGTAVHLHTPDGNVLVEVSGNDRAEVEHHARRIEANDAVIQAIIPMLRAVKNGFSKRVFESLDFPVVEGDEEWVNIAHGEGSSLLLGKKVAEYIRKHVMKAVNEVEDGDLLAMLPTVEIAAGPS